MTAITITCIIALIIIVLLFIPAKLEFCFVWNEVERKFYLKFQYLFFKKKLIPSDETKDKKIKEKKDKKYKLNDVIALLKRYKSIYDEVKEDVLKILKFVGNKSVCVRNLQISFDFDTEDPMRTGILTGGVNAFVYNAVSLIYRHINLKEWNINVRPLFENRDYFDIKLNGIMTFKNAHIILIIFKVLPIFFKVRKTDKKFKQMQNNV